MKVKEFFAGLELMVMMAALMWGGLVNTSFLWMLTGVPALHGIYKVFFES